MVTTPASASPTRFLLAVEGGGKGRHVRAGSGAAGRPSSRRETAWGGAPPARGAHHTCRHHSPPSQEQNSDVSGSCSDATGARP
jgi:hypothetical protein